ncbi:hypothetical protein TNCV_744251 [Trichonephila clavipes]|nr:hypothetical protein TNCV_744251 [Trichonephila clavipes]
MIFKLQLRAAVAQWSRSSEKSDIGYKALVPVTLICQKTSIKNLMFCKPVHQNACPDHPTTSTIVAFFDNDRGLISTTGLSLDENISRVAVQT